MKKYGRTSLIAVDLLREGQETEPREAWRKAALQVFPDSKTSRNKGCPRDTFLGLCEAGLVQGVKSGKYTRSKKNKAYGLKALSILNKSPNLASDEKTLWGIVMAGTPKKENSQMDVVITLWQNNLVFREAF